MVETDLGEATKKVREKIQEVKTALNRVGESIRPETSVLTRRHQRVEKRKERRKNRRKREDREAR